MDKLIKMTQILPQLIITIAFIVSKKPKLHFITDSGRRLNAACSSNGNFCTPNIPNLSEKTNFDQFFEGNLIRFFELPCSLSAKRPVSQPAAAYKNDKSGISEV